MTLVDQLFGFACTSYLWCFYPVLPLDYVLDCVLDLFQMCGIAMFDPGHFDPDLSAFDLFNCLCIWDPYNASKIPVLEYVKIVIMKIFNNPPFPFITASKSFCIL